MGAKVVCVCEMPVAGCEYACHQHVPAWTVERRIMLLIIYISSFAKKKNLVKILNLGW